MNDKTKKILMGLGVVFTAALMLTLYFFDWAMIGTESKVDDGNGVHEKFQKHIVAMNINYETKEEYGKRLEIFTKVDKAIEEHNAKDSKFKMGHNQMSTMTEDEKAAMRGHPGFWAKHIPAAKIPETFAESSECSGLAEDACNAKSSACSWCKSGAIPSSCHPIEMAKKLPPGVFICNNLGMGASEPVDASSLAESVDWRTKGAVNPVKNQGQCGSCYTFGSTAVVEASVFINGYDLPNLSEQQIVSCSQSYGNYGCKGGFQAHVFNYLTKNYQVTFEKYPYMDGNGTTTTCNSTKAADGQVYVTSHAQVTPYSVAAMKKAISEGVVTVTVDASSWVFQYYTSGILDNASVCGTSLDHAIAAVGYGKDSDGTEYYIVRNSWSAQWGDEGYIKMQIIGDGDGMCGIQMATFSANASYAPNQSGNEQS